MRRASRIPPHPSPATAGILLAVAFLGSAGTSGSVPVRHFVYGLNPRFAYEVSAAGGTLLEGTIVGPAGDLQFESDPGSSIRILVPEPGPLRGDPLPAEPGRALLGPYPNPARGATRILVASDLAGTARVRLYGISGNRLLLDLQAPIDPGITPIRLDLPPRAATGLYLIEADLPWGHASSKVILFGR